MAFLRKKSCHSFTVYLLLIKSANIVSLVKQDENIILQTLRELKGVQI